MRETISTAIRHPVIRHFPLLIPQPTFPCQPSLSRGFPPRARSAARSRALNVRAMPIKIASEAFATPRRASTSADSGSSLIPPLILRGEESRITAVPLGAEEGAKRTPQDSQCRNPCPRAVVVGGWHRPCVPDVPEPLAS